MRGLKVLFLLATVHGQHLGIPTTDFALQDGHLGLTELNTIIIDDKYAEVVDNTGETLIPPTLQRFARIFANDLKSLDYNLTHERGTVLRDHSIFITLGNSSNYRDAAGRPTSEGYTLSVSNSGIKITGASPLGAWWGTRTVLQQAILNKGFISHGTVTDAPGWRTRGMMLDAARHYYPPDFLVEMCAYMSFFKQNTLHLHLSDNLFVNNRIYNKERSLELYARFRLWSDEKAVAGLNKYQNESYTRDQFEHIQASCADRGVTILPEIEAPGHALVFFQWKPELALKSDPSLLNISYPDTIPTMKTVWSTFLPWFHSRTVSIGADEYSGPIDDYNYFVNAMADHIYTESNKSTRIWGTFPPVYKPDYTNIYQNVSIQHWEFFEDNPLRDYIQNNYSVLNSDDTYYVVNKYSGSYPQEVNISATFYGNPNTGGGLWYPYVFSTREETDNPSRNEPLVLGSVAPLWNDYGANTSVYSEAYYAWQKGIPALADKQWGGNLTASEFNKILEPLLPFIPGQNLERRIPSKTSTILHYSLSSNSSSKGTIPDDSGNGYDGSSDCSRDEKGAIIIKSCSIRTPLSSKGRNYTLTTSILVSSIDDKANATLISGRDSTLMLTPKLTFYAGGNYFRLNTSLPLNKRLDLTIIGRGSRTFAKIDGGNEEEFQTKMGINGERFQWGRMAFEAPLQQIGGEDSGWSGKVFDFKLLGVA